MTVGPQVGLQANVGYAIQTGTDYYSQQFWEQGIGWPPGVSLTEYFVIPLGISTPLV